MLEALSDIAADMYLCSVLEMYKQVQVLHGSFSL